MFKNLFVPLLLITLLGPPLISIKSYWFGTSRDDNRYFIISSLIAGYIIIITRYILIVFGVIPDNYV